MRSDPTLALVLDTALDSVIVMDSHGRVAEWNVQAEKIFGWSHQEAMGAEMAALIIPGRYRSAHHQGLTHFLATGEGPVLRKRIEIIALRKDGQEFPIELSISPTERNGETIFIGFIRDISERIDGERLLTKQAHEAKLLQHLTSVAAETSSLDEALTLCLQSVCDLVGWPVGHAFLAPSSGGEELIESVWFGDSVLVKPLQAATQSMAFKRGAGMPGIIWESASPVWISDLRESGIFVRKSFGDHGLRSAFGFPIVTGGEVVAVLEFFGPKAAARDESLILTAQAMGDQIGRVLERQRVQEHQTLLLGELEHRGKNMLAVVMGIATQTARNAPTVEAFTKDYLSRLTALASTYGLLTAKNWQSATLTSLLSEVVAPHLSSPDQLQFQGPDIDFPAKTALSISMVLHELTTNAAKYGALLHHRKIFVGTEIGPASDGEIFTVIWQESGVQNLVAPGHRGFGSKLIETTLKHELAGNLEVNFASNGVEYKMVFPPGASAKTATPLNA